MCNVLKTPHIALLALNIMDALGVRWAGRAIVAASCSCAPATPRCLDEWARLALSSSSELTNWTINRDKGAAIAFPRAVIASGLFGRQQRSIFPRSFAASGRS